MANDAKILIVDDSAFMRGVLKNILSGAGYTSFVEAENGVEAVAMAQSEKPALVLLDLIMPEKGGIDVLKEMEGQKVLVISAVGQETSVEEAKGLGALGYIVKPFDNELVLAEVEKALSS